MSRTTARVALVSGKDRIAVSVASEGLTVSARRNYEIVPAK